MKKIFIPFLLLAACVKELPRPTALSSFHLRIVSPTNLGAYNAPLDATKLPDFTLHADALGSDGQPFKWTGKLQIRISFGGNLTPSRTQPLPAGWPTLNMVDGVGEATVHLPPAFGELIFWVEDSPACVCGGSQKDPAGNTFIGEYPAKIDGRGNLVVEKKNSSGPCAGRCGSGGACYTCGEMSQDCLARCPDILAPHTMATGASAPVFLTPPKIPNVQTPIDMKNPDLLHPALEGKHVNVESATGSGKLVIQAVKADGFAVSDTGLPQGQFNGFYVYTYSLPKTVAPGASPGTPPITMAPGMTVANINGTIGAFNGFTEMNFPIWEVVDANPDMTRVPAPAVITRAMLQDPLVMKGYEAELVELDGYRVCNLALPNADPYDVRGYKIYNQYRVSPPDFIDANGLCKDLSNGSYGDRNVGAFVVSYNTIPCFNPAKNYGKTVPKIVGMLRHIEPALGIQDWVIEPRTQDKTSGIDDLPITGDLTSSCKAP